MAKMKFNFFGFHTYPLGAGGLAGIAEPLVWIGTADGYNHTTGDVYDNAAYETSWYQTLDFYDSSLQHPSNRIRGINL